MIKSVMGELAALVLYIIIGYWLFLVHWSFMVFFLVAIVFWLCNED